VVIVPHVHSPPSIGNRITWTRLGAMKTGRIRVRWLMETLRCGSITPREYSHSTTSQPGNPTHEVHALCDFRVLWQSDAAV
jgi:hypothetical protein